MRQPQKRIRVSVDLTPTELAALKPVVRAQLSKLEGNRTMDQANPGLASSLRKLLNQLTDRERPNV